MTHSAIKELKEDPINKGNENIKKQVPSFKQYCAFVLGEDLYEKVMSNPMPLSYDGQVSLTKLYAEYRKFIGKPFSSNVTE
jgi:hypothetical protein|tara:strand:- start:277 stop:519 length:243 start_codon:yes stop_codon:yes gene_type:complete